MILVKPELSFIIKISLFYKYLLHLKCNLLINIMANQVTTHQKCQRILCYATYPYKHFK